MPFICIHEARNEKAFGTAFVRIPFFCSLMRCVSWKSLQESADDTKPVVTFRVGVGSDKAQLRHLWLLYFFKTCGIDKWPQSCTFGIEMIKLIHSLHAGASTNSSRIRSNLVNALITNMVQCRERSARRYSSFPASVRNYKLAIRWTNDLVFKNMEQRKQKFTSLFSTSVLEPSEVDFETSTDAMQAAKQLKPRGPVRHDFSETLGIGEGWLHGLGGLLVGCHVSQRWQLQKTVSSNMFLSSMPFYRGNLYFCVTVIRNETTSNVLLGSSQAAPRLVLYTFYTLGSCQIKCVSCKAMMYRGPCQLPTNTNSNTHLAVLGFVLVYSGWFWY